jgi:hypothetical protein
MTSETKRLRDHQADFTPEPVVRQLFAELATRSPHLVGKDESDREGLVFLDPAAGAGVFGKVCAEVLPGFRRVAIEPRDEEYDNLTRHYHKVWDFTLAECSPHILDGIGPIGLIATNPPFKHALEFVDTLAPRLGRGASMWLLALNDFGQRSAAGRDAFKRYRPSYQLRIAGTVGFRGPGVSTDSRSYSWFGWEGGRFQIPEHEHPISWECRTLPHLPARDRRWVTRPGESGGK